MVKVGINGFGRIGRIAFRIALLKHANDLEIAAINTSGSMPPSGWAHLVTYDTMYRKFELEVTSNKLKESKEATDEDPLIGYLIVPSVILKKFPGESMGLML
ncbi:MAG: Glyceraldehyde-3-phosphate dehydrogenase, type I [Candidatus Woesebacteria bacterium GW2011_GWB1_39_10b]|uniref:Glyceraldehyde-3-phosphate dehydrogenase, type I n=1 Tax=Candidatus Woesebacteria bacterium GW2011_GWB1_39_10b TaxID=1618573 RepID=A0A0G0LQK6_9BACT|nr:MAG: Glyceraldehyde-3-phosphate dehydrogenase, type I [Candidatus Woesebacteria bacterium GW2011_GWB1_39_10b]